jgi:hypothetical protein
MQQGGTGTGGGLGSQGAVVFTRDGRFLLAVNAGSNDISSFRVRPQGLELLDRVASGGMRPISVTSARGVVYVLNAGGAGNISGFRINNAGRLSPISGSAQSLSSAASGPAQIEFDERGTRLVVTEKATNTHRQLSRRSGGSREQRRLLTVRWTNAIRVHLPEQHPAGLRGCGRCSGRECCLIVSAARRRQRERDLGRGADHRNGRVLVRRDGQWQVRLCLEYGERHGHRLCGEFRRSSGALEQQRRNGGHRCWHQSDRHGVEWKQSLPLRFEQRHRDHQRPAGS